MKPTSTFTNLTGVDVSKYLGYVPQNLQSPRLPNVDEREVNKDTRIDMSQEGLKTLKIGEKGRNLNWTTDINQELPIKMGSAGMSKNLVPETISAVFCRAAKQRGD